MLKWTDEQAVNEAVCHELYDYEYRQKPKKNHMGHMNDMNWFWGG